MNDMDEQSVSMGGKSTYFSGKFQKYSWKNLMDSKTSGVEKLSLYSEALNLMTNNENLPELFRDIFKDSVLPFKDPSTLNMFLKEINEFHYSNSEKLGDAFEYLLSFMGSQGDAGQFRTPRHIIDFIVEIVNPQKKETILDPSCGTAGFLISSYKHILKQNTKKNLGDNLNASDRKKIGENLNGYDISPDMVKMSLVNMYLHKFTSPNISEYDTLSSEDKWNEYYDVIVANPPFFSPKGGIMPHNRFGVKSTKAEVLFVDYINEHLKPNGRAGIIVPEGIVFQNGIAYKQLRKKLIDNALIAVISLPNGVFQPYSGVKTSILILDKIRNKKSEAIYFINIGNDGYSLNSSRNKIEGDELKYLSNDFFNKIKNNNKKIKILTKKEILLNESYSLTTSSYEDYSFQSKKYSTLSLKDVCNIKTGKKDVNEGNPQGIYPFFSCAKKNTYSDKFSFDCEALLIVGNGRWTGKVDYYKGKFEAYQRTYILSDFRELNCKYLYHLLKNKMPEYLDKLKIGNAIPFIKLPMLQNFSLPVPEIETQNQIDEELDGYQKIIDGCRQVIENYYPEIIYKETYKKVKLGEICKFSGGTQPPKSTFINEQKEGYIRLLQIRDYKKDNYITFIPKTARHKTCDEKDIMIGRYGPPVFQILRGKKGAYNVALMKCLPDKKLITNDWLYYFLSSKKVQEKIISLSIRVRQSGVRPADLNKLDVPLPSIDEQIKLCEKLFEENKTIQNNKILIKNFSDKIDSIINSLWSN